MGFLNHATNNIIIDAVLTERGRELLSQNAGLFEIDSFAFGDDEIDYSLIQKYGVIVGKEKIEKNTPIMEANPNENYALKYPLMTFENNVNNLEYIPNLISNLSSAIIYSSSSESNFPTSVAIQVKTSINSTEQNVVIDDSVIDTQFIVKINSELLRIIDNENYDDIDTNNIKTYTIETDDVSELNIGSPEFTGQKYKNISITPVGVVTTSMFEKYGSAINQNIIKTYIQIIGKSSGSNLVIPVQIKRPE